MIPELGNFTLALALAVALTGGIVPLIGAKYNTPSLVQLSYYSSLALLACLAMALIFLGISFVNDDFSVQYVTAHSNTKLPLIYKISAIWGGHEGSLLLWVFILSLWAVMCAVFSRRLPDALNSRALAVMMLLAVGFLVFLIFTSNPFERMMPATEGRDLNPLLQDPGLAIHPPMLYMGYVGFSVPFAYVVAALIGGKLDATWARWSRPWAVMAWVFLTIGIALGSWWAYYELGWGGWWFWDPVENASFMPWLMGTALIHTLATTEKRGGFKLWTVLLAVFTFSLSLLGTFLVRSGVLVSVHAFATDPERGIYILIFLALVLGLSFFLLFKRINTIYEGGVFTGFSRETFLLINNVLLVIAALTVLFGTLYPLIIDALGLGKLSVGPPYFNMVFVPLMLPMALLMGFGIFSRWKKDSFARIFRKTRGVLLLALILAAVWLLVAYEISIGLLISLTIAIMIILASLYEIGVGKSGLPARLKKLPLHHYGMISAHIGVGIFIIGVTLTSSYSVEKDVRMEKGTTISIQGYDFTMRGLAKSEGPNYETTSALIDVNVNGKLLTTLRPEKRIYAAQGMPMTEAAIDYGFARDLYVAMGEPLDDNSSVWAMRIYYKPFISWLWFGAFLMALGGILAAFDKRYFTQP